MSVVSQPVHESVCHDWIREDSMPVSDCPVAGQDCRLRRVPGIYDGVQVFGGLLIELLEGKVIEDK